MNTPDETPLNQAIVAQAVQHMERTGWLDDAAALRQALQERPHSRAAQYLRRAWLLGERRGLAQALGSMRVAVLLAVLALALAVALVGLDMARAAFGDGRVINAAMALAALLGMNLLALLVWLALLLLPGAGSGAWLGQLVLKAAEFLSKLVSKAAEKLGLRPSGNAARVSLLLHAGHTTLQRLGLWPYLLGAISHGIWALAFLLALLELWSGFAFRSYTISLETTILSSDTFTAFVQFIGWLPAKLGFPVPDAAAVQQALAHLPAAAPSGAALPDAALPVAVLAGNQDIWAKWLMGCVLIYGLLPRALLAVICFCCFWRKLPRAAQVDNADPHARQVFARFDLLTRSQVVDAEHATETSPAAARAQTTGTPALIGFELPPAAPWPPALPHQPPLRCMRVDGSSAQRQTALNALAALPPAALLLACCASASPDRGSARFLREAARHAPRAAVWLLPDAADVASSPAISSTHALRWQNWLHAERLEATPLLVSQADTLAWLQHPA